MLDGWYCRTMANEQAAQEQDVEVDSDDSHTAEHSVQPPVAKSVNNAGIDYKSQYRYLKRKLKFLIYENEYFQDVLRSNQRRLLKVSRDRAFLLDRLLQYEKPENDTSESDLTESSDDETNREAKKRKVEATGINTSRGRKKKTQNSDEANKAETLKKVSNENANVGEQHQEGHMTAAEVERHLSNAHLSRQPILELMPERATATVPTEMFSNEPSLDSETHDHMMDGSPSHVAAEECVPMEYAN